ncbi:MAG: hypothetical protein AB7F91_14600 [Parvularculaceae bacterium]
MLALLAADIYVAVAPEYQLARPAPAPAAVSSNDPVPGVTPSATESVAATAIHAGARDSNPAPATKKPNIATAGFAVTAPFQQTDELTASPLSVAIALMSEPSGLTGDAAPKRKGAQIVGPPGFDTLVALGAFGSGGGGNPGSPPTVNPVDIPVDNNPTDNPVDNPGGGDAGANPNDGETPPVIVPENPSTPPVIETPLPGAFILFASAIAGFSFSRRIRRG